MLFYLKRRKAKLYKLGPSIFQSYDEISSSYLTILKALIPLFLFLVFINALFEVGVLSVDVISQWREILITEYQVLVGVFVGSVFSYFVHSRLNSTQKKADMRKNSAALYNDLKNILTMLERYKIKVEMFSEEGREDLFFEGKDSITEINYNPKWRDHYSVINDQLPFKHYQLINNIYAAVENFNKAVRDKDTDAIKKNIRLAFPKKNIQGYFDLESLSSKQLINDLYGLTKNKKVRSGVPSFLFKELLYNLRALFASKALENKMVEVIGKNNGKIESDKLKSEIKNWLLKPEQKKLYYLCKGILPRLMLEVALKSDRISSVWGEYHIKQMAD